MELPVLKQYGLYGPLHCPMDNLCRAALRKLGSQLAGKPIRKIIPGDEVPTLHWNGSSIALVQRRWAAGNDKRHLRRRTTTEWTSILARPRFLVPASCYYQWETRSKSSQQFVLWTPGQNPFMFAAISSAQGDESDFSVVVGPATVALPHRFATDPLVVPAESWVDWLRGTVEQAAAIANAPAAFQPNVAPQSIFASAALDSQDPAASDGARAIFDGRPNMPQLAASMGLDADGSAWYLDCQTEDSSLEERKARLLAPYGDSERNDLHLYATHFNELGGIRLIAEFVDSVKNGTPIKDERLVTLAEALELLLGNKDHDTRLREFARRLDLNKSPGRREKSVETTQHMTAIWAVICLQQRGIAKQRAMQKIAEALAGDKWDAKLRAMQRWDRTHHSSLVSLSLAHDEMHAMDDPGQPVQPTFLCHLINALDRSANELITRVEPFLDSSEHPASPSPGGRRKSPRRDTSHR